MKLIVDTDQHTVTVLTPVGFIELQTFIVKISDGHSYQIISNQPEVVVSPMPYQY